MAKINKEEYEILKNLDEKWKWIAKDDNYGGFIFCFREKPHKDIRKGGWSPDTTQYKCLWEYDVLFQFIQWEDEEPYNIAELIEEYEHKEFYDYVGWKYAESEEAKVKKDIEWLKKEVNELPLNFSGFSILKQREEFTVNKDDVLGLIDQLDEPEVLSQEWIDEHSYNVHLLGTPDVTTVAVPREDLQNILVPKQELPVIPRFVAEFLIGKEDYMLYELFDDEWLYKDHNRVAKWLYDNDELTNREREFNLVLAQRCGYEVETEQKYYVINNDQRMMLVRMMDGKTITEADPFKLEDMYEIEKKSHRLTEQEIKDYDERYFAFAKPVEEVEK